MLNFSISALYSKNIIMYSNTDFEKLWFLYTTEV